MNTKNWLVLAGYVTLSEAAGIIGSVFTTPTIQSGWYGDLIKPALNPPAWVFGPVWTILFALMGISLFLVWKQHSNILENVRMLRVWKLAIALFFFQLVLNTFWSIIFFGSTSLTIYGLNNIGIAFIEIIFLWLAILATIIAFYKISRPAAWLLVPYLLWVSFATYLNVAIWVLN